jgi:endonuclease G
MPSKEELVASYLTRLAAKTSFNETLRRTVRGGEEVAASPAAAKAVEAAQAGLAEIERGRIPTLEQTAGIEAIILPKIRPVLDVVDGKFRTDHPLWLKLNDDADTRRRLEAAVPLIGRIELPGNPDYPYGGTGFVVGQGLVMTNRHVAAIFTSGVGTLRLSVKTGHRAGIDFLRELDRPTGPTLMVKRVVMIHPYWDMALLAVEGLPDRKPLVLSQRNLDDEDMIEVAAIGFPAFDTRNDRDVQNDLFRKIFGVKRLQPGTLGGNQETESFGKMVPAVRHNCSTLGGNSGSALIDLETGEVVALHFGGRYGVINFGVPAGALAKDGRVVDTGIQFAAKPAGGTPPWASWWRRADEAPVREAPDAGRRDSSAQRPQDTRTVSSPQPEVQSMSDGTVQLTVPLHVTLRIGVPGKADEAVATEVQVAAGAGVEGLVIPFHDEQYDSRAGYIANFLGVDVPMPEPADLSVVAKAKDGSSVLSYQNFSIVMHRQRRLALFTASNVTAEPSLKQPDPSRRYTRKALSGLGPNDQERWFPDTRLDEAFQLPDVFFTRDQGAFDKGHIVRREVVAWGTTYDLLRRANGDTYHVTNCSPQVADFNQASRGEDNWGDLENHILAGAASERYCQFAGPVLAPDDDVFVGADGGRARVRVRIPSRFWKVIVVRTDNGIEAYGFVLEQDFSAVPVEEFLVPESFRRFMEPISDLELRTGVRFPAVVRNADQHDTNEGVELAFRAGVRRRSIAEGVITEGVMT